MVILLGPVERHLPPHDGNDDVRAETLWVGMGIRLYILVIPRLSHQHSLTYLEIRNTQIERISGSSTDMHPTGYTLSHGMYGNGMYGRGRPTDTFCM